MAVIHLLRQLSTLPFSVFYSSEKRCKDQEAENHSTNANDKSEKMMHHYLFTTGVCFLFVLFHV